jgi:hypothetical protein
VNIRYRVELSETERTELLAMLSAGTHAARKLKRAQILLAAEAGVSDEVIATSVTAGSHSGCSQAETPLIPLFKFPEPALCSMA